MFPVPFFTGILFRNFFTSSSHEICFSFHSSFSSRFLFFHCYSFSSLSFRENYSVILFCYVRKLRSSSFQMVNDLTFFLLSRSSFFFSLSLFFPSSFFLSEKKSFHYFLLFSHFQLTKIFLSKKDGMNPGSVFSLQECYSILHSLSLLPLFFFLFFSLSLLYFLFLFFLFIFSVFESSRHVDYNSFVVCLFKSFHVLLM